MAKHGRKYQEAAAKFNRTQYIRVEEVMTLIKETAYHQV